MTDRLAELQQRLHQVTVPLVLQVTSSDAASSAFKATREILQTLLGAAGAVQATFRHDPDITGVMVRVLRDGLFGPVSFWGTPSGFEMEGLVYALECQDQPSLAAKYLEDAEKALLADIAAPLQCSLYVAPT